MGSSKPREVTVAARRLLSEHPEKFSRDFKENKKSVKELTTGNPSMLNEVAGAISAEMRKKAQKKAK